MGQDEFFQRCKEVRERISTYRNPLIINHFDCDGLSSGAITAIALQEMGKKYAQLTVRKMDDDVLNTARAHSSSGGEVIFVDLGGACAEIDELKEAVILDHHQTQGGKTLQANPHLFGLDGGTEISSSGVAYFTFHTRVDLGIVGAIGDMQFPLKGLNRIMLEEGAKKGEVSYGQNLRLYGRGARPLAQMLEYADEPFLPGLTANQSSCAGFLEQNGFWKTESDKQKAFYDLPDSEQKRFINLLVSFLAERGNERIARDLIGEVYTFPLQDPRSELYDASEFSTLLNACGRNRHPEIGLGVCMGDTGAYLQASSLLATHRKNLRDGISFASAFMQDFGKFYFLDARGIIDDGIIGVVAGMALPHGAKKPIFAISLDEKGQIKISGRGNAKLVAAGLNIGAILHEAAGSLGGVGGGHKVAAGASLPKENLNAFLVELGKLL